MTKVTQITRRNQFSNEDPIVYYENQYNIEQEFVTTFSWYRLFALSGENENNVGSDTSSHRLLNWMLVIIARGKNNTDGKEYIMLEVDEKIICKKETDEKKYKTSEFGDQITSKKETDGIEHIKLVEENKVIDKRETDEKECKTFQVHILSKKDTDDKEHIKLEVEEHVMTKIIGVMELKTGEIENNTESDTLIDRLLNWMLAMIYRYLDKIKLACSDEDLAEKCQMFIDTNLSKRNIENGDTGIVTFQIMASNETNLQMNRSSGFPVLRDSGHFSHTTARTTTISMCFVLLGRKVYSFGVFSEAIRSCESKIRLTHTAIFPNNCRMYIMVPLYRGGFIDRQDEKYIGDRPLLFELNVENGRAPWVNSPDWQGFEIPTAVDIYVEHVTVIPFRETV